MEIKQGFDYTVKGHEELEDFTRGITALTNAKSSRKDTIVAFRTFEGTNIVEVHSLVEVDEFLEQHFKEITEKKSITIAQLSYEDLDKKAQQWIDAQAESTEEGAQDYVLTLPSNFFWD